VWAAAAAAAKCLKLRLLHWPKCIVWQAASAADAVAAAAAAADLQAWRLLVQGWAVTLPLALELDAGLLLCDELHMV
jgi:hypothetical protein